MNSVQASYQALARYYDAEHAAFTEDLPAYDLLADRFAGHILDVGCGTGRVTRMLAGRGHQVTGIDISEEMLTLAQEQFPDLNWVHADILTWKPEQKFSLAIFSYNGFSHLLSQPQQLAALASIYSILQSSGGLVIDMANPLQLVTDTEVQRTERSFHDLSTGGEVVQQSHVEVDAVKQILNVRWVYTHSDGEQQAEIPMEMRYVFAPEMQLLLQMSGYGRIEQYGDYDFGPYTDESPRLFTVAQVD